MAYYKLIVCRMLPVSNPVPETMQWIVEMDDPVNFLENPRKPVLTYWHEPILDEVLEAAGQDKIKGPLAAWLHPIADATARSLTGTVYCLPKLRIGHSRSWPGRDTVLRNIAPSLNKLDEEEKRPPPVGRRVRTRKRMAPDVALKDPD